MNWLTPHIAPIAPEDAHLTWALACMLLAALITGIAKSGFGGGIGILAVPLVANALRPDMAIAVMLPVLITADLLAFTQHRKNRSKPQLNPALSGGLIGILLGTFVLMLVLRYTAGSHTNLLKQVLGAAIGFVCLIMVSLQAYKALGGKIPELPQNKSTSITIGAVAGLTSTLAHAAGPIMTLYWLQAKLSKPKLIGTLVTFFMLVNACKLIPYVFVLNLINTQSLIGSCIMFPAVPIGALVGWWMQKRIPEKPFMWVMYGCVLIAGGRLIGQAF